MGRRRRSRSIFTQPLGRSIFVAYFLGGIVPLLVLALVLHFHVFPTLKNDLAMTQAMLGVIGGVSLLSLASYFALRRISLNAVERMKTDNLRLENILAVSRELSTSSHTHAVAELSVASSLRLTSAEFAYLMMRPSDDKPLVLVESSGEGSQACFSQHESLIRELVEAAIGNGAATALRADTVEGLGAGIAFPMISKGGGTGAIIVLNPCDHEGDFSLEERDALMTLSSFTGVALHNVDLQDAQRNFFAHITELLVSTMDVHVDDRKGHARAVAAVSNLLARELDLPEERMQTLHFAALLHDIGMLKVEARHQRSPRHFQRHPQVGHRVLSRIRLWEDIAPIVLSHHEWWDGSGYPEAIEREDIPFEARIIAVADCYDSLMRPTKLRMAMTSEQAVQEIREYAGRQFDPAVSSALERLAERGELPSG
ncbi:MAG: HD domain-containing protein [Myxococcota bacterium]|jgi:putative nucleotidyltransferase with HDIG domain|nr:HD domain-containing protein [Myxococcota bacterium]